MWNFIGINFYDPKLGTPAVSCDNIVTIVDILVSICTEAVRFVCTSKNLVEGSVEHNCLLNQFFCVFN
uniref:Uncharacterized protein n=1 Tax=Setaria viridis TaxID=4556 RepID=A0A4V6D8F2_SETVI|nr:hypothetical protein SEVIR_6G081350v2 [Setaria viridis]